MPMIDPTLGTNLSSYNALLTTTLQKFQKQIVDNFSDATPTLWWLTQNDRKKFFDGGQSIEVPLMYAASQVQAFSGYDDLLTEPTEGIAPATFVAKKYQAPVVISRDHETDNMGESRVVSLLEAKVKQAEISFREQINSDIINNGYTGALAARGTATPDPLKITGMFDFLQDTNMTRAYGGIASTGNTWWQNQFTNFAGAGAGTMIDAMRTIYLDCSRGADSPDLILAAQDSYEAYEGQLVTNQRFVNTLAADAGFESLMFRATTVLFDRDVPDDTLLFLNSNYINLNVHRDVDMTPTPFREAERQWVRFSRIMWKGELSCSNRARQGLLHDCPL